MSLPSFRKSTARPSGVEVRRYRIDPWSSVGPLAIVQPGSGDWAWIRAGVARSRASRVMRFMGASCVRMKITGESLIDRRADLGRDANRDGGGLGVVLVALGRDGIGALDLGCRPIY